MLKRTKVARGHPHPDTTIIADGHIDLFDVVVLLVKSVFGFSDGSTPFWQSTIEWPLQTALVNQMIHLHNATLHNPKFVEISTDVGSGRAPSGR